MTEADMRELEWWRHEFATRFAAANLPRPGTALYGRRLKIVTSGGYTIDRHGQVKP